MNYFYLSEAVFHTTKAKLTSHFGTSADGMKVLKTKVVLSCHPNKQLITKIYLLTTRYK